MRDDRDAGGDDLLQACLIEVGQANVPDLAGAALLVKPRGGIHVTRNVVVPPVQLHQIDALHAEARERAVNAAHDVGSRVRRQPIEVGYVLGVHLHGHGVVVRASPFQPLADERFHAGVNVGAVEGRDARVHEPIHVGHRGRRINRLSMTVGQLPAALQQARDGVAGRELNAWDLHVHAGGSGTAVTSRWRNARVPMRVMRNLRAAVGIGTRDLGVGGHPVVRVRQPLLRRKDRQQRRQRVNGKRLARGQREVFPAQLEPVTGAVAAHHRPIRGHHFDAQIVELERVVAIAHAAPREYVL